MIDLFSSFIYGIIQGLAEFLPISSSGHLALLPHVLDLEDPGVAFDLAMHVGTAISIMIYFHRDVRYLTHKFYRMCVTRFREYDAWTFNMFISTLGTVLVAALIKDLSEQYGRGLKMIAFNLFFFGLLLFLADFFFKEAGSNLDKKSGKKAALMIGLAQALALFPGVSRSGITITMARFLKIPRKEAGKFSFLLSLPLILAGAVIKLPELANAESFSFESCLFGVAVSAVVGFLTIHYFLRFIQKVGLWPFFIYRIALGALILFYFSR